VKGENREKRLAVHFLFGGRGSVVKPYLLRLLPAVRKTAGANGAVKQ
jgi:hypothetical protein